MTSGYKDQLRDISDDLYAIQWQMIVGCFNHGCQVADPPNGLGTNDRCRCSKRDFARRLRMIADNLDPNP